jgi:hypothetical protein
MGTAAIFPLSLTLGVRCTGLGRTGEGGGGAGEGRVEKRKRGGGVGNDGTKV